MIPEMKLTSKGAALLAKVPAGAAVPVGPTSRPVIQRSTPGKSPDGAVCLPREASGKRPMRVVLDFGLGLSYHKAGGKKRNFFLNF